MRLVRAAGLLLCMTAFEALADQAVPPTTLAVQPFTFDADASGSVSTVQQHVIYWIRRWGQAADSPQEVEARLGPDAFLRLAAERANYVAVLSGHIALAGGQWTAVLEVKGLRDEKVWQTWRINQPSLVELMNSLIDTARDIEVTVKLHSGQPLAVYIPPTRPYATLPFIVGGVAVVTGVVFFALAASESGKLSDASLGLSEAVSARNTANTYQVIGYTTTAVGVVGLALGLWLYHPGAVPPPPPPVSISVDPLHGMLLVGGRLP